MANGDQSNEQQVQTMMRQQWEAILACQDEKKAFCLTIAVQLKGSEIKPEECVPEPYRSRLGGHEYTQFPSSFEKGWLFEHIPFDQVEECLSILGTMLDDWTFQSEPLWLPSRSDDGLCLAFLELIKAYEGYKVFVNLEPQLCQEQFEQIADVFFVPVYA